ncbi:MULTISPECIES: hypothetical protein [unclassified Mesorhizobium]|uniref:hypothetical protein n=2 Tax=Mesorhizobium TaxID=68287 RepID=UPI001FE00D67|nr:MULTISPECIES: hypothetical protein [unclassified Mesorhizobium]MDG4890258.1 hypothetical protein [Mesorhizobium sp. WSM4887]MDG4905604.1 hypothetical protein [Mesorhizobium sp. WSM4898]WIE91807.1 hypothetical protein P9270_000955 [Mesorhizobium sp. WSM4875]
MPSDSDGAIHSVKGPAKMVCRTTSVIATVAVLGLGLSPAAAFTHLSSYEKTALTGQEILVFKGASLNVDCSSAGKDDVKIISGPSHGEVRLVEGKVYTSFAKTNQRFKCNSRKVDGIKGVYKSAAGFKGQDQMTFSVHTFDGNAYKIVVDVNVE